MSTRKSTSGTYRSYSYITNAGGTSTKTFVHPTLEKASEFIDDPEWKEIIISAATGKFPQGYGISAGGYLTYRKKITTKVIHDEVFLPEDPMEVATIFVEFIRSTSKYNSKIDRERILQEHELEQQNKKPRKKAVCSSDVDKYVNSYCQQLEDKMTPAQLKSLKECLNFGFAYKIITPYCSVDNNGNILKMGGIKYNSQLGLYYIDPEIVAVSRPSDNPIKGSRINEPKFRGKTSRFEFKTSPSTYNVKIEDIIEISPSVNRNEKNDNSRIQL